MKIPTPEERHSPAYRRTRPVTWEQDAHGEFSYPTQRADQIDYLLDMYLDDNDTPPDMDVLARLTDGELLRVVREYTLSNRRWALRIADERIVQLN